jgi:hypothetical protein
MEFSMEFAGYTLDSFGEYVKKATESALAIQLSAERVRLINIRSAGGELDDTSDSGGSYSGGSYDENGRRQLFSVGVQFDVEVIVDPRDIGEMQRAITTVQANPIALVQTLQKELSKKGETIPNGFVAVVLTVSGPIKTTFTPTPSPTTTHPTKNPTPSPTESPTQLFQKGVLKAIPADVANNRTWALVVLYFFLVFVLCCLCGLCCGGSQLQKWYSARNNRTAGKKLQDSLRSSHSARVAPVPGPMRPSSPPEVAVRGPSEVPRARAPPHGPPQTGVVVAPQVGVLLPAPPISAVEPTLMT